MGESKNSWDKFSFSKRIKCIHDSLRPKHGDLQSYFPHPFSREMQLKYMGNIFAEIGLQIDVFSCLKNIFFGILTWTYKFLFVSRIFSLVWLFGKRYFYSVASAIPEPGDFTRFAGYAIHNPDSNFQAQ